ncbi:MAG: hypothetical protein EP338_05705 [Bacteroidetes bacterium]|nr:MAG: hypothetical protein EP338_05705 [Bacteroidota bacterium]
MKWLLSIICLILAALLAYFMEDVERIMTSWGLAWTFSKGLIYFLLFIASVFSGWLLGGLLAGKKKGLKWILLLLLGGTLFGFGFYRYPIYQGQFANDYKKVDLKIEGEKYDLIILSLPNCPYCHETVPLIQRLKTREKELKIAYAVFTKEENKLGSYAEELKGAAEVFRAWDYFSQTQGEQLLRDARHAFPAFLVLEKETGRLYKGDGFGTRALDELENR